MTTFEHTEENAKGLFIMKIDGKNAANMTYSRMDANNVIIDHTAATIQGQGAGKQIVLHMVEWARENKQKVLPLCPFAKGVLAKNLELQDILRR